MEPPEICWCCWTLEPRSISSAVDSSTHRSSTQAPSRLGSNPMIGGTDEANRSLRFWRSYSPQVDSWATPAEFFDVLHQAGISGYDLILGCPFMVNNSMGPLPHHQCLVIASEDHLFYLLPRSQGDVSAVETTPPSVPPDDLPDRPTRWVTSSYTIQSEHPQMLLHHFGCPTPMLTSSARPSTTDSLSTRPKLTVHGGDLGTRNSSGPILRSNGSN